MEATLQQHIGRFNAITRELHDLNGKCQQNRQEVFNTIYGRPLNENSLHYVSRLLEYSQQLFRETEQKANELSDVLNIFTDYPADTLPSFLLQALWQGKQLLENIEEATETEWRLNHSVAHSMEPPTHEEEEVLYRKAPPIRQSPGRAEYNQIKQIAAQLEALTKEYEYMSARSCSKLRECRKTINSLLANSEALRKERKAERDKALEQERREIEQEKKRIF